VETLEDHVGQIRQVFIDALQPEQRPQNLSA
jgi:hypothetical protein